MESAAATYYYNEQGASATVALLKHTLSIQIQRDGGLSEVIWYYDQIMKADDGRFLYPGPIQQALHIPSSAFTEALMQRMRQQAGSIRRHRGSTLLKLLLAFVVLAALFYFVAVPRIASGLAGRVSLDYEKELGEGMYRSLQGSFTVDEQRTVLINDFFRQLNVRSPYDVKITVVKGDIANAFAIPGGRIVVYDKLLNGITSYPQLAALLAHEYVHVQNRHTLRSLFRQMSSSLFLSLFFGNLDVVGAVLIQNTDQLKDLSYSRSLETEADEQGAALLANRRIDCNGFVQLFQLLQKETGGGEVPEFINSHPNLDKRIRNIQKLAACQGQQPQNDNTLRGLFLQLKTAE